MPSWAAAGRVYVTVDNHLHNDYEPYIWVSEDYGATFQSINAGLQFDEDAEIGNIPNGTVCNRSRRMALGKLLPWIRFELFHAK